MKMGLSVSEGAVLHGLLAEAAGDIVLKLDADGFIQHASPNITELGFDLSQLLLLPHIADLAEPVHRRALKSHVTKAMRGTNCPEWIEFTIALADGETGADTSQWHALGLRPVVNDAGEKDGLLGLLRSVEHLRVLEDELHVRSLTDPLTGLDNTRAFRTNLKRRLHDRQDSMVAVFEIERFRAILLQYGQDAADEVLWAFAQFLKAMARPGQALAHLDAERFGVALPDSTAAEARAWCEDVLETFATLALGSTPRGLKLAACAGLARLEASVDHALKQAELALVMARASGGMRVAACGGASAPVVYPNCTASQSLGGDAFSR